MRNALYYNRKAICLHLGLLTVSGHRLPTRDFQPFLSLVPLFCLLKSVIRALNVCLRLSANYVFWFISVLFAQRIQVRSCLLIKLSIVLIDGGSASLCLKSVQQNYFEVIITNSSFGLGGQFFAFQIFFNSGKGVLGFQILAFTYEMNSSRLMNDTALVHKFFSLFQILTIKRDHSVVLQDLNFLLVNVGQYF